MTIGCTIHRAHKMEADHNNGTSWIKVITPETHASVFVPTHVATATAAAFNRAMEVKEADSGLVYTTDAGHWYIEPSPKNPKILIAQHEDYDGNSGPNWMSAEALTLEALQDLIDDIVDAEVCTECHKMAGEDNTTESANGEYLCNDCLAEAAELEAGLREMADDDKAHAQREAV